MPPPDAPPDITDFLRRLASMMSGGRNAEMLSQAADLIDSLARRAMTAEELFQRQQDDHAKDLELREVAELASDHLLADVAALQTQLDAGKREGESARNFLEGEIRQLLMEADEAEQRIAQLTVELEELRKPLEGADETIAVVPVEQLRLARAQFEYLAQGFAQGGDVISLTICEIGACALDKALGKLAAASASD